MGSSKRMRELIEKKDKSDQLWAFACALSAFIIIQDLNNPELMPGDTDWILLMPTLITAVIGAMKANYYENKIKERTHLFNKPPTDEHESKTR